VLLLPSLRIRALNEPDQWGPSDHCRVEIQVAPGMRLGSDNEEIKAAYSCAAAHSGKRLRSDENQASVINACSGVVCIACDLFNKLAVDLEDLVVGAVKVHTVGKISQCLVAHPTK
jgi:hypothetical protein